MSLLFCDGFDHYMAADIFKKWTGYCYNNNMTIAIGPQYSRPPGGNGLRLYSGDQGNGISKTLPSNNATLIVGGACYFGGVPSTSDVGSVFWLHDSANGNFTPSNSQVGVRGDGAGHIGVYRGDTLLALSTNVVSVNTWYFIELKVTIHNTTGAYELRVNGSSTGWVPPVTGANTRGGTGNNYANMLMLGCSPRTQERWFDDIYVCSSAGSVNNDFLGPLKVFTIFPDGAGSQNDWAGNYSSNYANVNEAGGDGDATFNQSATVGNIDLFAFGNVPLGTIAAIQHTFQARQDAGAQRTFRPKTRISGANYSGDTLQLPGSHAFITDVVEVSPATSTAWAASEVNAAEFGYELVS